MKVGIIGAGKVGSALCKSLKDAGTEICGLTAATKECAQEAAEKLSASSFDSNQELVPLCDVLFLTVPDRLIGEVAEEFALAFAADGRRSLAGKTFLHCSGSLGLEELRPLADLGAEIGSLHPLQSFASSDVSFRDIYMAVDGSEAAQTMGKEIATSLGAQVFHVPAEERKAYHAAACFASNYVVTAVAIAQELMSKWAPTPEAGLAALMPLFDGTANNLHQTKLAREVLTGPIARGDTNTIKAHLAVLPPKILEVYKALGRQTVCLARENGTIDEKQAQDMQNVLQ